MIFIDTGAWYARADRKDVYHSVAMEAWPELGRQRVCYTSSLVLAETCELIGRRVGYRIAAEVARHQRATPRLGILRPTADDEARAIDLMEKFADQPIGFVDCVSFVLMRQHHLTRVFGFDRHFAAAGFTLWPSR